MCNIDKEQQFKKIFGFDLPKDNWTTAMTGKISIDAIEFQKQLGKHLKDYDDKAGTYKGKPISVKKLILKVYKEDNYKFLISLI